MTKPLSRIITYLLLILGASFCLLPFVWQLRSSLMTMPEIFSYPPKLLPAEPQWKNYPEVFNIIPFGRYYGNTIVLVAWNVVGVLISNIAIAFALTRLRFKGRNTFLPLIVPSFFGNAFFIFMLVQFFRTIPFDYDEAALIDGASYPRIMVQIILPMARPIVAVMIIFTFLNTWNDFMGPLLYLNDSKLYTLALGLKSLLSGYNSYWHLLMAAATLVVMSLLIVFFIGQKSFIAGLTMGVIKG